MFRNVSRLLSLDRSDATDKITSTYSCAFECFSNGRQKPSTRRRRCVVGFGAYTVVNVAPRSAASPVQTRCTGGRELMAHLMVSDLASGGRTVGACDAFLPTTALRYSATQFLYRRQVSCRYTPAAWNCRPLHYFPWHPRLLRTLRCGDRISEPTDNCPE